MWHSDKYENRYTQTPDDIMWCVLLVQKLYVNILIFFVIILCNRLKENRKNEKKLENASPPQKKLRKKQKIYFPIKNKQ